jgi:hypothetical protein
MLQHLEHMWDSIAESPKGTVGSEHLGLKMRELEKEMTLDTPQTSIQLSPSTYLYNYVIFKFAITGIEYSIGNLVSHIILFNFLLNLSP